MSAKQLHVRGINGPDLVAGSVSTGFKIPFKPQPRFQSPPLSFTEAEKSFIMKVLFDSMYNKNVCRQFQIFQVNLSTHFTASYAAAPVA